MLAGSFLAGSSPEGGGAVAFPVFTKVLHVGAPAARSFGLCIQAVGMTVAAVAVLINRRAVHKRACLLGGAASIVGFVVSAAWFTDFQAPYAPSLIGVGWVKATFSIVLATTSVLMVRHLRHGDEDHQPIEWNRRLDIGLVIVAFFGGALASVTGTGANIMVFLFLVVLADVSPRTALATAVLVMAAVSVIGFGLFAVWDHQLSVEMVGDRVVAVGGDAADLSAERGDLLGLWLAAVPIVVWGAPLGSLAAAVVKERVLVGFVAVLAGTEVITTFVLVEQLRTDRALLSFLVVGLALVPTMFLMARTYRYRLFRSTPV